MTSDQQYQSLSLTVEDALPGAVKLGDRHWRVDVMNGKSTPFEVCLDEGWLSLEAAKSKRLASKRLPDLVEENRNLEGMGKFGMLAGSRQVRLQAETPVDGDIDLVDSLRGTLRGFGTALGSNKGGVASSGSVPAGELDWKAPSAAMCAESGWAFEEKSDGRLLVKISAVETVSIAGLDGGGLRVSSDLAKIDTPSAQCREAIAMLLLRSCAAVRMARAVTETSEAGLLARYEVRFSGIPAAEEMDHAISAVATGARLCGREVAALADADVAAQYLGE